uniref:Uncharacterized protein n=1 Tax=Glossina morsitans morsitans TaxID=37546 RepID=A0A1B0FLL6_GLOMM
MSVIKTTTEVNANQSESLWSDTKFIETVNSYVNMRRIAAQVVPINDKEYYIALKVARVCTFICYLPSCLYLICYAQIIDELAKEVCFCKLAIIPDDFNAWAIECSGIYTSRRSEALLRAFVNLDVFIC